MNSTDLAFIPALEQAQLIRNKVISPLELTQLYLDRIQTLDASLNSFFTVMAEQALAEAKAKTEQLAASHAQPALLPPFFGVPIAIKDFAPVAGVPCTYGIHLLKKRIASEDAGLVTRIRQAGFTILGKTATSEIGTSPYTESRGFLPTRNPWNLDYTPGGSSGGSAAAVAAGLCAIAQGGDAGGSVRIPAGFTSDGLPLSVQLVGRPGEETTVIALAAQIEALTSWSQHRPSFAAQKGF